MDGSWFLNFPSTKTALFMDGSFIFVLPSMISALFMDGNAKQRAGLTSDLTPDLQDEVQAWRVM